MLTKRSQDHSLKSPERAAKATCQIEFKTNRNWTKTLCSQTQSGKEWIHKWANQLNLSTREPFSKLIDQIRRIVWIQLQASKSFRHPKGYWTSKQLMVQLIRCDKPGKTWTLRTLIRPTPIVLTDLAGKAKVIRSRRTIWTWSMSYAIIPYFSIMLNQASKFQNIKVFYKMVDLSVLLLIWEVLRIKRHSRAFIIMKAETSTTPRMVAWPGLLKKN